MTHRSTLFALALSASLVAAGCGPATAGRQTVSVAYAGSLQLVNDQLVGPQFTRRFHIPYQGRGGGSFALAQELVSHEISANVFISVGPAPIALLEPRFTDWYVQFATSPLVLAYNPQGAYAPQLRAIASGHAPLANLFAIMQRPGFRLGRTNPSTDPQGRAFALMVELAVGRLHLAPSTVAGVLGGIENPNQIFSETTLDARLQAGQLDAASAFLSQAVQLHLPYISLPPQIDFGDPAYAAAYASAQIRLANGTVIHGGLLSLDITMLKGADQRAAIDFINFVLSPAGLALYRRSGYGIVPALVVGRQHSIPASVLSQARADSG